MFQLDVAFQVIIPFFVIKKEQSEISLLFLILIKISLLSQLPFLVTL